ncbi:MAG TPA: hypothetical protein VFG20_19475 [Planctomycetaceae bacterium]|nr:hypothetical protein [Planctomycetaceae bacterium]
MTESSKTGTAAERKRLRRQRRWLQRLALAGMIGGVAAGAWAFEQANGKVGLQGVFPSEPPAALGAEAFAPLDGNWANWSTEVAAQVADFYKLEGDVAAQRAKIAGLKKRLGTIEKALGDSRYAPIATTLSSLHGPLSRRIALAEAMLDTLEMNPEAVRGERLKTKAAAVTSALSALERDLNGLPGGNAWLPYVKAADLKQALAAGGNGEAAVAAANATKAKLARRESLTDKSQQQFLSRSAFLTLETAVDGYLAAATSKGAAADPAPLQDSFGKLVAALEGFEAASTNADAAAVRAALASIQQQAADGGDRITAVINEHYLNDNLRFIASEAFVSKLISDSRVEQGQVNDYILGANVGGWQTTQTSVSANLKPAIGMIKFDLLLNGYIQSNTAGATDQATIYTSGNHSFQAAKEVTFDGVQFRTAPATIGVNANNTTTGANTRLSGVPIFGRVAQRIAIQEAGNRRPQAEAIARSRIADRVLPRFNAEADKAFGGAGGRIDSELNAGLKSAGIYPDRQRFESTDSHLKVSRRLTGEQELAGAAPEALLVNSVDGARLVLHDSVVNNTIDRIDFSGKTMSEEELRHHVEAFLTKALAREFKFRAPQEVAPKADAEQDEEDRVPAKIAFAKEDPIRVQFQNGQLMLVIRAGLEREGRDPIPTQEISVPLTMNVVQGQIAITRGELQIVGIDGDLSGVQRKVIINKMNAALPDRKTSARIKIPGANRDVEAQVSAIQIVNGWIGVSLK